MKFKQNRKFELENLRRSPASRRTSPRLDAGIKDDRDPRTIGTTGRDELTIGTSNTVFQVFCCYDRAGKDGI